MALSTPKNGTRRALMLMAALTIGLSVGCGAGRVKLNPDLPIERRSVTFGSEYTQEGRALDASDLVEKLEREPHAHDDVSAARTASFLSMLFSALGGGLIGIPLGEAAGKQDPHWILAAAGGGMFVLSIPLMITAAMDFSDAVDSHNRGLKQQASTRAGSLTGRVSSVERTSWLGAEGRQRLAW
jgi:hypothetical protein